MASTQSRSSGLFSGLVLISVGVILLLHNYGHLESAGFLWTLVATDHYFLGRGEAVRAHRWTANGGR